MRRIISLLLAISILASLSIGLGSSVFASDEETSRIDYSDLTTNQYLAKIFTNHNYFGALNDYGNNNDFPPYALMEEFYLDPDSASKARLVFNEFNEATDYKTTHGLYELLTFSGSSAVEKVMQLEDYYTAILLSILDTQMADGNLIDDLNCKTNKTVLTLSKNISKYLESTSNFELADNLKALKTEDLDYDDFQAVLNICATDMDSQELWKLAGKDIGVISDIFSVGSTVNDAVKNIADFAQLANLNSAAEEVLRQIYLNCPDDNLPMKNAARKVYEYVSGQMSFGILALSQAGYTAFEYALSEIVGDLWKSCLTAVLGELSAGILIGQAVGKLIANYCFATDAIDEQLCAISALVDFEDVMVASVRSLENIYKKSESVENSDNYVESLHYLMSTYDLGCEYVEDFVEAVYRKGFINDMIYNDSDEYHFWLGLFANQKVINKQRDAFLYLEKYKAFYKIDAPSAYEIYFNDSDDNNGIISVISMDVAQKKEICVGDKGASYDFFSITYYPYNHTEMVLGEIVASSNESIIKIDDSGLYVGGYIYAVAEGTCTLTFTTYDLQHSASIEVTVGDSGDFEGYIPISTKEDLDSIRNNLSGKYFLTQDIEFNEADFAAGGEFYNNGQGWQPIGADFNNAFVGEFEGNGHIIKGLYLNIVSSNTVNAGLFGYIGNGSIRNLGLVDSDISVKTTYLDVYVGGFAGVNYRGTLDNCYNTGNITASADSYGYNGYTDAYAGGIVGSNPNGDIKNCYNTGKVNASSFNGYDGAYAGGIAGECYETIDNCYNTGDVTASSVKIDAYAGGIAGCLSTISINNCYNTGNITASSVDINASASAGGIVGISTYDNSIYNCHNIGNVTASSADASVGAGGILGGGSAFIKKCYNTGNVTGFAEWGAGVGGIAIDVSSYETIENCYNTGTVIASTGSFDDYTYSTAGGIVASNSGVIDNCYNIGNVVASSTDFSTYVGGIAGGGIGTLNNCYYLNNIGMGVGHGTDTAVSCTEEQMKDQNTFVGFDFDTIWKMGSGEYLYPILIFEEPDSEKKELHDVNSGIVVADEDVSAIPKNAELQVINTEMSEDRVVYDITLKVNGQEVQPNGTVTVKIPAPSTLDVNKCKVYRVEISGVATDMGARYSDGYLIFTTDHFSEYIITIPHEHAYDFDTWVSNGISHWHECKSGDGARTYIANHSGGTANCTAKAICAVCGASYGELTDHIYVEQVEPQYLKSMATCMDKAVYYKSCSICGEPSSETFEYGEIDPNHHIFDGAYKTDAQNHWKECECGEISEKDIHTFGEWKETKAPTENVEGIRERSCTVCGYTETETIPVTEKPSDLEIPGNTTEPIDSSAPSIPSESEGNSNPNGNVSVDSPQTGDDSQMAFWLLALIFSGTSILVIARRFKKESIGN